MLLHVIQARLINNLRVFWSMCWTPSCLGGSVDLRGPESHGPMKAHNRGVAHDLALVHLSLNLLSQN